MATNEPKRTSAFAHLLNATGIRPLAARLEDEKGGEKIDDDGDDAKAEDGDDEKDEKAKGKKAKKAKAEDEENGDDEKCEEEDGDDEDMAKAAHAGRHAEKARCRRIFRAAAAGSRPDLAAHLAFETDMPSAAAISLLTTAAEGGRAPTKASAGLGDRMATVITPKPGADGGSSRPLSLADQITAAGKKLGTCA